MHLSDAVDAYLDEHECSRLYAEGLRRQIRKLAAHGVVTVSDLTARSVNAFLSGLPLSQTSRANARREICTIWRFCHEQGWTDEWPSRVRRIRCRPQAAQAWSYDQLSHLVKRAMSDQRSVSSRVRDLLYSDVIPVWASIGWESGLRFADIHALRGKDFRNGVVCVTAQKTGKVTPRRISAQTFDMIVPLLKRSPDGTLFRWALPRRRAFVMWREFLDGHKLPGSSRWLRRSCATFVDNRQRGAGTRYLDHDNESTTKRYYIDPTLSDIPEAPPPLKLN